MTTSVEVNLAQSLLESSVLLLTLLILLIQPLYRDQVQRPGYDGRGLISVIRAGISTSSIAAPPHELNLSLAATIPIGGAAVLSSLKIFQTVEDPYVAGGYLLLSAAIGFQILVVVIIRGRFHVGSV